MWRWSRAISSRDEHKEKQLWQAAEKGKLDRVQYYLHQQNTNVNAKDVYKQTALHWASANGHEQVVRLLLLDQKVQVDAKDTKEQTPLILACENKHEAVVKCLLKHGANPNAVVGKGETVFHKVCQTRDSPVSLQKEVFRREFYWDGWPQVYSDDKVIPTLKATGETRNETLMQLLLEHGAEINAVDCNGKTPLHKACCCSGNEAVVRVLLEHGADMDAKDASGMTPIHLAILVDNNMDNVQLLLEQGSDMNAKDKSGQSPLHAAISKRDEGIFRLLLEHGADVDTRAASMAKTTFLTELEPLVNCDSLGQLELKIKPLQRLVTFANDSLDPKVIAIGIDAGRQLGRLIPLRHSPRFPSAVDLQEDIRVLEAKIHQLPVQNGKLKQSLKLEKLKHRLTRELDAQKKLKQLECPMLQPLGNNKSEADCNETALFLAAENGTLERVVYYLNQGANPNAENSDKRTVLSIASEKGHDAVVALLLQYGADMDSMDFDLHTPLHHACSNGREAVVMLLLQNGATPHPRNKEGKTALELAEANGFGAFAAMFEPFIKLHSRAALDQEIRGVQQVIDAGENPKAIADATCRLEMLLQLCQCKRFASVQVMQKELTVLESQVARLRTNISNVRYGR